MATTQLQTRILNKISTWPEWESVKATFKPHRGEICIVEIPTDSSNSGLTSPATGIKVGDGNNYFGELPWIQALAGDVTAWCKENMADYDKFKAQVAAAVADSEGKLDKAIEDLAGRISALENNYTALNNTVSSHTTSITSLAEEIGNKQPAGDYALKSEIPAVPVQSVNGKTGAVQLSASDVGALPADTEIPAPYTLPTASADTLGGVKVGNGLQMTDGVLGVVTDGDFELIETINTSETVDVITRTALNLSKIYIKIISPATDAAKYCNINMRSNKGRGIGYFYTNVAHEYEVYTHIYTEIAGGFIIGENITTRYGEHYEGNVKKYRLLANDGELIYYLGIGDAYVIPIGATVEIWGVRA